MITCTEFVATSKKAKIAPRNNSGSVEVMTGLPAMDLHREEGLPVDLSIKEDLGLYLYRNPITRERVVDYFTDLTGSRKLTDIILRYSDINNLPLSLSFALAETESSFNPSAVNRNSTSVDRGLFQLNSRSFPSLSPDDFFDPEINARYGLKYLKECLDQGGNIIVGLAMYNAGKTRVANHGTPRMTLDYIARIMESQEEINADIEASMVKTRVVNASVKQKKTVKYVLDTGKYSK